MMRTCPRDGSDLVGRDLPGLSVSFCASCHGFAIDVRQAEAFVRRMKGAPSWPVPSAPPPLRHDGASETCVACPCGAPATMWPLRSGETRIDYCPCCRHLWLDRGEAAALERFLEGPYGIRSLRDDESIGAATRRAASPSPSPGDGIEAAFALLELLVRSLPFLP